MDSGTTVGTCVAAPSDERDSSAFTLGKSCVASTDAEEAAWLREEQDRGIEAEEEDDPLGRTMSIPVDACKCEGKGRGKCG